MFLLGLLHAMKRSDQTHHSKTEKKYLTIKYTFDEIEICETAFLHIYSLRRSFCDDTMAIIFLSISDSYIGLYRLYESSLEIDSEHYISRWTFLRVWKKYIPEIKFLSPRSDLCFHCKNMRFNTQFWNQDEKDDKVKEWHEHNMMKLQLDRLQKRN
ncbi:unnamed protein product [Rhizophagus irregularis]|nr:unnamed protein product [Rhizophagus irregularis]